MVDEMRKVEKVEIRNKIISYQSHYSLEGTNQAFKVGGVLMVSPAVARLLSEETGPELIKLATNLPVVKWTNQQWEEWLVVADS